MGRFFYASSLSTSLKVSHPLEEVGQFVLWNRSAMVGNEAGSVCHKGKRLAARRYNLKAARRQESRYQKKPKKVVKSFPEGGNTVGVNSN